MVKYNIPSPKKEEPTIIEQVSTAKEPEKTQTEEESQTSYNEQQSKRFFDEDDEIIEVNFD